MWKRNYIGFDQYGTTYHNLGPYPRKALSERLVHSHPNKMYVDTGSGSLHVGYVFGKLWVSVYAICPIGERDNAGKQS